MDLYHLRYQMHQINHNDVMGGKCNYLVYTGMSIHRCKYSVYTGIYSGVISATGTGRLVLIIRED